MNDFSNDAAPLLSRLTDDPNSLKIQESHSDQRNWTNFPGGGEIDGELHKFSGNAAPIDSLQSSEPAVGDASSITQEAYQMEGMDILAFYKSYRFKEQAPFPGEWGIFLLDAGISGLTSDLMNVAPDVPALELR